MSIRAVCLVLVTLVHLQIWSLAEESRPVCETQNCRKLSRMYRQNMNKEVNPCTNFYKHACDRWAIHYPLDNRTYYRAISTELEERALKKLMKAIEDNNTPANSLDVQQAIALYRSCFNIKNRRTFDVPTIIGKLKKISDWSDKLETDNSDQPWNLDQQFIRTSAESALFDYELILKEKPVMELILEIRPLISPYGIIKRLSKWINKDDELNHYKSLLRKIIKSVSPNNGRSDEELNKDIDEVISFREKLRHISKKTITYDREVVTIKKLQEWYDKDKLRQTDIVKVNWVEEIKPIFKNIHGPFNIKINQDTKVEVNESFPIALGNLLTKVEKRVIVNHIHLYYLEKHLQLDADMRADLEQSVNNTRPTGLIREDKEAWIWCFEKNNMMDTLRQMYVDNYFQPDRKIDVGNIMSEMMILMKEDFNNSGWMTPEMKQMARDKVDDLLYAIGYLDGEFGPTSDPYKILDPLDVNAYYRPYSNKATITAAYMQLPVYSLDIPFVIKYGAVGSTLGHELYHAFDGSGIKHRVNGKSFSHAFYSKHKINVECFQRQYKDFIQKDYDTNNLQNTGNTMPTENEDTSDVMGLKLAYYAYRSALKRNNGVCPTLPGFEDYSCEKLFFLANANIACANIKPSAAEYILLQNEHSLPETRVNGGVANMKEFSDAFECKSDDPMNLAEKCDLWRT